MAIQFWKPEAAFTESCNKIPGYITTKKYNEVSQRILRDMERGTTLFYAEGGYTGDDYKVVEVVFDRKAYNVAGARYISCTCNITQTKAFTYLQ